MSDDTTETQDLPSDPAPLLDMLDLDVADDTAEPDTAHTDGQIVVTGTDAQDQPVDLDALCALAASVLRAEGVTDGRLDLHLVPEAVIAELNHEHMGGDGSTDVLAFPLDHEGEHAIPVDPDLVDFVSAPDDSPMLGDVVLCPAVALRQAPDHAGSSESEFALLVIHGVLHVLGHDHVEDEQTLLMQSRERVHLESLGHQHPVPAP